MLCQMLCPLCDSDRSLPLRKTDKKKWKICVDCDHIFCEYEDLPLRNHDEQQVGFKYDLRRHQWANIINIVSGHLDPKQRVKRWLDIGFGDAGLILTANEYGYVALGVDIREKNVADLMAAGVEAYCVDFEKDFDYLNLLGRSTVISMTDVIEHIRDPKGAIEKVVRMLASDGLLLIGCPNASSHIWKMLDAKGINPYWDEEEHFHNFTRERLESLLVECGFDVIRYMVGHRFQCGMELIARKHSNV